MAGINTVLDIVQCAMRSVATTAVVASAGFFLARQQLMPAPVTRGLSHVTAKVTIPALLFSKQLDSVDIHLLRLAWPMVVLPFIYTIPPSSPPSLHIYAMLIRAAARAESDNRPATMHAT